MLRLRIAPERVKDSKTLLSEQVDSRKRLEQKCHKGLKHSIIQLTRMKSSPPDVRVAGDVRARRISKRQRRLKTTRHGNQDSAEVDR